MSRNISNFQGCLLGMAVGDAMGYTIDEKTWEEICENYGPNGLLGYDLQEEFAQVTSYTQVAAYVANGLLLGVTRGKQDYVPFVALALREWGKRQHFPRDPEKTFCWVAQLPALRRRHCRDARMLDAMRFETLGTLEKPINKAVSPGGLTAAAMVGLFFDPKRMEPAQVGTLAAQSVALTHGDPEAFLSGAVLAYSIAGIIHEPERPLPEQFLRAAEAVEIQFSQQFPQAEAVTALVKKALALAEDMELTPLAAMTLLGCTSAAECLAGAIYASAAHVLNFDEAMIAAVNHSGRSAAVGAITGAILGAKLGAEALPEFYLESLDCKDALAQLAEDMAKGNPAASLFDDDWDQKYMQGTPVLP